MDPAVPGPIQRSWSLGKGISDLKDDLSTLRHLWFSQLAKTKPNDHAARLESFYGPQAAACECDQAPRSRALALLWALSSQKGLLRRFLAFAAPAARHPG
jgi:hypothetical protein